MPYLIDGHNLIAQLPDISLSDPDDEYKLITKIKGFIAKEGKRCVVIFDGGVPGGKVPSSHSKLDIVFASAHHSDADTLMTKRIRKLKNARRWVVITSDRVVLSVARRYQCQTMRASEFAKVLARRSPKKPESPTHERYPKEAEVEEWLGIFGEDHG